MLIEKPMIWHVEVLGEWETLTDHRVDGNTREGSSPLRSLEPVGSVEDRSRGSSSQDDPDIVKQ
jgi:hypothetical protein